MTEEQTQGPSGTLAALKTATVLWARTLKARCLTLVAAAAVYMLLFEGITRLVDLVPSVSSVLDWSLWLGAGLARYTLFEMLCAFAALQVLAVVDGRTDGLRSLLRRLPLAMVLALISGVLVFPLDAWLHSLAQTESRTMVAQLSAVLKLAAWGIGLAVYVLTKMAMPSAVDRDLTLAQAFGAGSAIGVRRWGSLLLAALLLTLIPAAVSILCLQVSVNIIPYEWIEQNQWFVSWQIRDIPSRVLTLLAVLYWPALYVALRPARA